MNIDVVLVIDLTGSMHEWIKAARETLLDSFSDLQKKYPTSSFRLGVVGYRDFSHHSYNEQFIVIPLTRDIKSVQTQMMDMIAAGGDDIAEDVAGALQHVLDMNWNDKNDKNDKNKEDIKVVLWVCDAPAHGKRYHAPEIDDRFPKGDPLGRDPYQQVKKLAEKGVDMTIFRIDPSMDIMIDEFYKAYLSSSYPKSDYSVLNLVFTEIPQQERHSARYHMYRSAAGWIDLETYDQRDIYHERDERDERDEKRNKNGRKSRCGFYRDIDDDEYESEKRGEKLQQKKIYKTCLIPNINHINHIMKVSTTQIVTKSIEREK
jgi:von Willebrand factor type A domain